MFDDRYMFDDEQFYNFWSKFFLLFIMRICVLCIWMVEFVCINVTCEFRVQCLVSKKLKCECLRESKPHYFKIITTWVAISHTYGSRLLLFFWKNEKYEFALNVVSPIYMMNIKAKKKKAWKRVKNNGTFLYEMIISWFFFPIIVLFWIIILGFVLEEFLFF